MPPRKSTKLFHTASLSIKEMLDLLRDENAHQRFAYYKRAVRAEHMHDFHYPDPLGAPNPSQPCAKLMKGTVNLWYCANGYPREMICEPCNQSVSQDAMRSDLWRVSLCRNCQLMNSHMPLVTVGEQSNTDGTPVVTKHQAEMYCCKYCSKHTKHFGARSVLFEVVDDMGNKDKAAKEKYGDAFEQSKLGGKLHRAFMSEIGDEVCQAEVAHHSNKCPEYLCSRPEKSVAFYKPALALNTAKKKKAAKKAEDQVADGTWSEAEWPESDQEVAPAIGRRKLRTKPSDIDMYERRTCYWFEPNTPISPMLPPKDRSSSSTRIRHIRIDSKRYSGGKGSI